MLERSGSGLSRRALLCGGLLAVPTLALAACGATDPAGSVSAGPAAAPSAETTSRGSRVLLAYFSRAGENYYNGGRRDLEVGNTAVLAGMIAERIGCDVFEIEAADPYSDDYDDTVARNVREQEADARPAIAGALPSIADHDVVILGSPLWNVRPPMILETFTEALDFTGKTVHPLVTYAVSGLGSADEVYRRTCRGARFGEALAVRGERVARSGDRIDDWLGRSGLTT